MFIKKSTMGGVAIHFSADDDLLLQTSLELSDQFAYSISGASPSLATSISEWMEGYFKGKSVPFQGSLSFEGYTTFQTQILLTLSQIPFATTISYQELGRRAKHPHSARAVGGVCNKNPFPLLIPCHRVIYANGKIGGFALDLELKKRLLEKERTLAALF